MLDVVHRRFIVVESGIMRVTMGHLGLVSSARVLLLITKPSGLFVMVRRLLVVKPRRRMMRCTAQFRRRRPDDLPRSHHMWGKVRGLRQGAKMVLGIVRAGFVPFS